MTAACLGLVVRLVCPAPALPPPASLSWEPPPVAAAAAAEVVVAALDAMPQRAPLQETRPDRWMAEDKLRHFFMSFGAATLTFGAIRATGIDGVPALAASGGTAAAAGAWKEWRDARTPGETASLRDLVWDAAGIAVALALLSATD